MALLKFNKQELVNLSYSLRREIICANKTGAYCNTSIIGCNTRRYHGLLAVTLDRFGGNKYVLLSSLDENILVNGAEFSLGIHCYGDIYEPRGHKYIVDFKEDPLPEITFKIGEVLIRKTLMLVPDEDRTIIRYELLESPSDAVIRLRPLLAFRDFHCLTSRNDLADTTAREIKGGATFRMYPDFPDLSLQVSGGKATYNHTPCWYYGVTYSDEYRRGFDCREDLMMPGFFQAPLKKGEPLYFSASVKEEKVNGIKTKFEKCLKAMPKVENGREQLVRAADILICNHNSRKKITAGFSWMYTGLLRETLIALPGLTLYGKNDPSEFEEILDNLIADEQERLYSRTTQVEAPLYMARTLQAYIDFGADPVSVWKKYGAVIRRILESYLPGVRKEVAMQPNGLLWAEMQGVALTWMNAYLHGWPVTPRAGYQVETNALWYNAICFALDMESSASRRNRQFISKWTSIRDLVRDNFTELFWNPRLRYLADYVDGAGQHMEVRPNQLYALAVKFSPVDEEMFPAVLRAVDAELMTTRGIRTLSPRDQMYRGVYDGMQEDRDLAYHQGSTRPFLLAPYAEVSFKVKGQSFLRTAVTLLENFYDDLGKHGVGSFSELYDGDPPHEPHGAISSALSVAALLTLDHHIEKYREESL